MNRHITRLAAPAVLVVVGLVPAAPAEAAPVTCQGEVVTMVGTSGPDHLQGTPGPDVIAGLAGHDTVDGLGGDDLLCGGPGRDVLRGGEGDDRLHGGADGYAGDQGGELLLGDRLLGGPGDDRLDVGQDPRSPRLSHRTGDAVDYLEAPGGVVVDLSGAVGSATGDGTDTIVITRSMSVHGSPAGDTITGSRHRDTIIGRDGDDTILGRGGDDVITADTTSGGSGDDLVRGGSGDDLISSYGGHDALYGGPGDEWLFAHSTQASTVDGGGGDDVVEQYLTTDQGPATRGGAGFDHLALYGAALEGASPRTTLTIDLRDGTTTADTDPTLTGTIGDYEEYRLLGDLRWQFFGTPGRDRVWAIDGGPLEAWTYAGDDWLLGTARADFLDAGAGRDEVRGGGGDDTCLHYEKGSC